MLVMLGTPGPLAWSIERRPLTFPPSRPSQRRRAAAARRPHGR